MSHWHPSGTFQQVALRASSESKMCFSFDTAWGEPKAHFISTHVMNTPLGRFSTPETEGSWRLVRDEGFSQAKPEAEEGRRQTVAHTAEPLSLCFTTSFLICSVFNQLVPQGNQNLFFMSEGSGRFWDGEQRGSSTGTPSHCPGSSCSCLYPGLCWQQIRKVSSKNK